LQIKPTKKEKENHPWEMEVIANTKALSSENKVF
jgi:hypothetical protein